MTKGTTGELEAKRHGKQLAVRGAGGKDDSNTKQDQERLKQKLRAKRTESFDDDDNAIIEEIKNRVIAILGEKVAGQEGEGQSGSGARRRANIPPTADSKFLELRKKRQQQTRQASPE